MFNDGRGAVPVGDHRAADGVFPADGSFLEQVEQVAVIGLTCLVEDPCAMSAHTVKAPFLGAGCKDFCGMIAIAAVHILAEAGRCIRIDGAVPAPFIAQDLGVERIAGRIPLQAQTGEGLHDAARIRHAHGTFKGTQIAFTESLFGKEAGHTVAVEFLIIAHKMLGRCMRTGLFHGFDFGTAGQIVHGRALGHVLEAAAAEGRAVQVVADVIVDHELRPHTILAQHGAAVGDDVIVERAGHDRIGAVAGRGHCDFFAVDGHRDRIIAAHRVAAVADTKGGRQFAHGRAGEAFGCRHGKIVHLQLIDEFLPCVAVGQRDILHGCEVQAALHFKGCGDFGKGRCIFRLHIPFAVEDIHHFRSCVHGGLAHRIGAGPVIAAQVGACTLNPVVQVAVLELIGDCHAVCAIAVLFAVEGFRPLVALCAHTRCGHAVVHGVALGCKHIVERVMGIVADGQIVVAFGEDVSALSVIGGHIIAGQQITVHSDLHGLGSAGLEKTGLAEAHNGDRGFFHPVINLILTVRGLCIQLHNALAGDVAGVLHRDRSGDFVLAHRDAVQCLFKRGIAQTITEGILDFIGILPGFRTLECADVRRRIALAHHGVRIAGLIVAVADIDVFCLEGNIFCPLVRTDGIVDLIDVHEQGRFRAGVHGCRG